ncbi:gamma conglutin 1-like [Neltuma alba]|uniref:gamma conglutin 1-like n=1 Tax=Neltuma alba TaxID=207710 RepID=UPI0010A2F3C0|nr:gamma conglutin 1-like [Prosopis alba]
MRENDPTHGEDEADGGMGGERRPMWAQLLSSLFFVYPTSLSQPSSSSPVPLVLPLTKHRSTLQYLTPLSYGSPSQPADLVLHLGGSSLWFDCSSRTLPSSSSLVIPSRSIHCLAAKSPQLDSLIFSYSPDQRHACRVFSENSVTETRDSGGALVRDLVLFRSTENEISNQALFFTCSPTSLLNGLASGAKGMVGLGRTRSSLASQIFASYNMQRKFCLCLSSSTGFALFGGMATEAGPIAEFSRSLTFTPLITPQNEKLPSEKFFIGVNSVKINGKRLTLKNGGGIQTELSSIMPYTSMESSIYSTFKEAFLKAAVSMNITRVTAVEPFGLCFSSRGINWSQVGPNVPVIDLVLQSEMVKWRIHGRNSMVGVNGEVMCLAFVDGGVNLDPSNRIVIGGYQLEDVIVEFDLDTSMVGFSPSLLMSNAACSGFRFSDMASESV